MARSPALAAAAGEPSGAFYSPVLRRCSAAGVTLTELHQVGRRRFPRHTHEHGYVALLLAGSYRERLGRRVLEQGAGTLVFHPPGVEHADEVGEHGGRFLIIELAPRWIERLRDAGSLPAEPVTSMAGDALLAATRMHRELTRPPSAGPIGEDPLSSLMVEGLTLELLAAIGRLPSGSARRPPWLDRVSDALRADLARSWTIAGLALEAGVHPATLARAFSRFQGCSPGAYQQRARVERARRLLAGRHEQSLAEIAQEAGFADQSHLTRVFRRILGTTPGTYRRRLRATVRAAVPRGDDDPAWRRG